MKSSKLVLIIGIVALIIVVPFAIWLFRDERAPAISTDSLSDQPPTQAHVLEEARNYTPPADTMCTMAMTPAVHTQTGARYTFPSGCIPDGWERVRSFEVR